MAIKKECHEILRGFEKLRLFNTLKMGPNIDMFGLVMKIKFLITRNSRYNGLLAKDLKEGEVEVFEKKLVNTIFLTSPRPTTTTG